MTPDVITDVWHLCWNVPKKVKNLSGDLNFGSEMRCQASTLLLYIPSSSIYSSDSARRQWSPLPNWLITVLSQSGFCRMFTGITWKKGLGQMFGIPWKLYPYDEEVVLKNKMKIRNWVPTLLIDLCPGEDRAELWAAPPGLGGMIQNLPARLELERPKLKIRPCHSRPGQRRWRKSEKVTALPVPWGSGFTPPRKHLMRL